MGKEKKIKKNKRKPGKTIEPTTPWVEEKISRLNAFLEKENKPVIPSRNRKAALLSIQYRMEYYLLTNNSEVEKIRPLEEFLASFLKILDIPFKVFALSINATDANLKKYLSGQRSFNIDLAMKFGAFFQMPPELWLNIQAKNDMLRLQANPETEQKYSRFNYENLMPAKK